MDQATCFVARRLATGDVKASNKGLWSDDSSRSQELLRVELSYTLSAFSIAYFHLRTF